MAWQESMKYLLVIKFEPLRPCRVAVGVVMAPMNSATMDEHTVQTILVPHSAVSIL